MVWNVFFIFQDIFLLLSKINTYEHGISNFVYMDPMRNYEFHNEFDDYVVV